MESQQSKGNDMKIELEFTESEIEYISNGRYPDFLSEQIHRFEVIGVSDGSLKPDNLHFQAIDKFLSEHDGQASLCFVGDQFLAAKIYADWWSEKLSKKCHLLWDTVDEEFVVWVPKSFEDWVD